MAINIDGYKHKGYDAAASDWRRCRAVIAGGAALRAGGFLAKPTRRKWTPDDERDWLLYQKLAVYYNGVGRIVNGMEGMVFKIDPVITAPPAAAPYVNELTSDDQSLREVAKHVVSELLAVGRVGLLVDYPPGDDSEMTLAERAASGRRPFLAIYAAEAAEDWRVEKANGKVQLVYVKLREEIDSVSPEDEFKLLTVTQYRILDLVAPDGADASAVRVYRQRIFQNDKNGEWMQVGEPVFPKIKGEAFQYIPFTFVSPKGTTARVDPPPIVDLADIAIAHYQNSADYEWGLHWSGSPTPTFSGEFATGAGDGGDGADEVLEIRMGSRSGIHFADANGRASFLEFTGQGLGGIKEAMAIKWDTMAALGGRIIASDKKGVEAAKTAEIRSAGENSVLADLAGSVSEGLSWALGIVLQWAGVVDAAAASDVLVELNREYLPTNMDPAAVGKLVEAWMADALSKRDLFYNWHRGGIIDPATTYEEWLETIEAEPPVDAK